MLKIVLDENLPKTLAQAMDLLDQKGDVSVVHITDVVPAGTPDEEWASHVGRDGWCVITLDRNILRRKHEIQEMTRCGVGLFVLRPPKKANWCKQVQMLVRRWSDIKGAARSHERPYAFNVPSKGAISKYRK